MTSQTEPKMHNLSFSMLCYMPRTMQSVWLPDLWMSNSTKDHSDCLWSLVSWVVCCWHSLLWSHNYRHLSVYQDTVDLFTCPHHTSLNCLSLARRACDYVYIDYVMRSRSSLYHLQRPINCQIYITLLPRALLSADPVSLYYNWQ